MFVHVYKQLEYTSAYVIVRYMIVQAVWASFDMNTLPNSEEATASGYEANGDLLYSIRVKYFDTMQLGERLHSHQHLLHTSLFADEYRKYSLETGTPLFIRYMLFHFTRPM